MEPVIPKFEVCNLQPQAHPAIQKRQEQTAIENRGHCEPKNPDSLGFVLHSLCNIYRSS